MNAKFKHGYQYYVITFNLLMPTQTFQKNFAEDGGVLVKCGTVPPVFPELMLAFVNTLQSTLSQYDHCLLECRVPQYFNILHFLYFSFVRVIRFIKNR